MFKHKESFGRFFFIYSEIIKLAWEVKRNLLLVITIMSSVSGMLVLPSLIIDKLLIDTVLKAIADKNVELGTKNIVLLIFLTLLIDFVRRTWSRFERVTTNNMARLMTIEIRMRANKKINCLEVQKSENPEVRDKYKKIYDMSGSSAWSMVSPLYILPFSFFTAVSALIAISSYSYWYVLLAIALSIPPVVVGIINSTKNHRMESELSSMWRVWNAYEDFLSKGRYIYENKILGNTDTILAKLDKLAEKVVKNRFKRWIDASKSGTVASLPSWLFSGILRGYFYFKAVVGEITLGTAQMQFRAVSELSGAISGMGRQINEVFENYLFVRDYVDFMELEEEKDVGISPKRPFTKGIIFENVWFKYPQGNKWILKGVNFEVGLTDNVAIVGKNGAGKTTIIKLLCGFYKPQKGKILVNGEDVGKYSPYKYRKTLSALFQDFAQYPFSTKENIGFGDTKRFSDIDAIKKSAEMVGIDDFVKSLPKGYLNALDNELEGGIEPSKGQWQRLALARALFRNSEIYILDEPTSNVDPEAEEEIFNKILSIEKEKNVVLVSHRFSTVRKADKIILLENGKIAESGSHEELISKKGQYFELFNLQAKSYDIFNSKNS